MMVIQILLGTLFLYLALNAGYVLFFSVAGLLAKQPPPRTPASEHKRFVILMPCYKGDEVIKQTARAALEAQYPKSLFRVVVIADQLQPQTVAELRGLDLDVVEVQFENSTKAKSLKTAVQQIEQSYDYALILDIDNVMEPAFLEKMNHHLQDGKKFLQGHRVAKNTNTPFAILDAVSEEVNNHIFRSGHRAVGLSAAFIGSGKAMQFDFFKRFIQDIHSVGEDKEMELKLLSQGEVIHYAPDALIYDEKIQEGSNFQNQRKRWLGAQFLFLSAHFRPALLALLTKGNVDYFDKMLQMMLLPRLLLLGSLFLLSGLAYAFPGLIYPGFLAWGLLLAASAIAIWIAVPRSFYRWKTVGAIFYLPKAFVLMFTALFKLKGASKKFIHTEHHTVEK